MTAAERIRHQAATHTPCAHPPDASRNPTEWIGCAWPPCFTRVPTPPPPPPPHAPPAARVAQVVVVTPSAGAADAEPVDETPYDALDIRVGRITKAWKHPEADKLFIEEVDIGEEEVRCSALPIYALAPFVKPSRRFLPTPGCWAASGVARRQRDARWVHIGGSCELLCSLDPASASCSALLHSESHQHARGDDGPCF